MVKTSVLCGTACVARALLPATARHQITCPGMTKKTVAQRQTAASREAAEERSPRRKPWVESGK